MLNKYFKKFNTYLRKNYRSSNFKYKDFFPDYIKLLKKDKTFIKQHEEIILNLQNI